MDFEVHIALISVLFASQILVLSFLAPRFTRQYYARMFDRFPAEEYPRLYPLSRRQSEKRLRLVKGLHFLVGSAAVVTLFVSLIHGASSLELTRRMFCCLLFQIVPTYISIFWTVKLAKALRTMPPPSVRSAELRSWRLVDFVPPLWIGLGIAAQVLALCCALIAYLHSRQALLMAVFCAIISAAWLARMIYLCLGQSAFVRPDPYMSAADTFRVRQRRFRVLFQGATAVGVVYAFLLLYQARLVGLNFNQAYTFVGASIVMQLLWLGLAAAQSRELQTRDFSVYRADHGGQAGP